MTGMAVLYPTGYGTQLVTLDELKAKHHPDKMHPEYARRLFGWIEAQGGLVGIGGSWRATGSQPDKPGFAPEGKSFHQFQQFPSGQWFAAVDLVCRNPGGVHRAPMWSEVPKQGSDAATFWGVHANVSTETWHIQPIEIDGWQGWVNAGRPDLEPNYPHQETTMQIVQPPRRILDTRTNTKRLVDGETVTVAVPNVAESVFVNITVTSPVKRGFVTAWSGTVARPDVSNLNFGDSGAICNTSWVPLAADRTFAIWVSAGCHVIVDLQAVAQ
jgi:hypothetical protein